MLYGAQSILLFLFVSLSEEIFMRGIVLNYLMLIKNAEKPAILISAIIFSLFHMLNPNISSIGFLNIFLAGILLAQVFIYSNFNIWVSIGLHWAWNFFKVQFSVFPLAKSKCNLYLLRS
ncbi:CPBP family intramembrane glutamic endopeptidase [Pedobacter cryoconitis]|uniref:Membrane protease YdiL (CAAX protease family) n=1 Tax=Pedobacter cryoconitis TaxID=188932 RepID=A0A7X0J7U5_9SPHI|nr:membrane protease YdiL (CAAX protease family) [Pedobacter cryoconitis]